MTHTIVEIDEYPAAPFRRLCRRADRILGGEPKPIRPIRTIRVAGPVSWSEGEAILGKNELIQFGVKFTNPVICDMTGRKLYGFLPIEIQGNSVRFVIDHAES